MPAPTEGPNKTGLQARSADEYSPATETAGNPERGRESNPRRLKAIGVGLPILFFLTIELIRLGFTDSGLDFHSLLMAFIVVAVIAFSFMMFHFIERAQAETAAVVADLKRRQREGHGSYDVLLRISNQEELADVLAAVARNARDLLASDHAAVCLDDAIARSVHLDSLHSGVGAVREGVCISPDAGDSYNLHDPRDTGSLPSSPQLTESLQVPIQSRGIRRGELWIGRNAAVPFTERDGQFLSTLSGLASIAITSAQMRESERQAATLAERERIARELHDSLAQVLGVTHLRLRAIGSRDDVRGAPTMAVELAELADVCEEGYRDVRGAILDLRESSRTDRDLVDGLRAYLDKYSHQCGIATSLETTLDHDLALPPRSEIQIIRVIQEALTNVRKHSGAASAAVRITQENGTVRFVVEDDGRGFDSAEALLDRDGFGLHSMRERMELIGGTLLTDSGSGQGTRIVAEVSAAARADYDRLDLDVPVR
jgi:two-component system nitrate/nitrite sensor histidine kinase NarX